MGRGGPASGPPRMLARRISGKERGVTARWSGGHKHYQLNWASEMSAGLTSEKMRLYFRSAMRP